MRWTGVCVLLVYCFVTDAEEHARRMTGGVPLIALLVATANTGTAPFPPKKTTATTLRCARISQGLFYSTATHTHTDRHVE